LSARQLLQSPEALEALVSLRSDPRFAIVIRDVADYTGEATKKLVFSNGQNEIMNLQGIVRGLSQFLEAFQEAPKRLENLRQRT